MTFSFIYLARQESSRKTAFLSNLNPVYQSIDRPINRSKNPLKRQSVLFSLPSPFPFPFPFFLYTLLHRLFLSASNNLLSSSNRTIAICSTADTPPVLLIHQWNQGVWSSLLLLLKWDRQEIRTGFKRGSILLKSPFGRPLRQKESTGIHLGNCVMTMDGGCYWLRTFPTVGFGSSGSVATVLVVITKPQNAVPWIAPMTTYETSQPSQCSVFFQLVASIDWHVVITTNISVNTVARRLQRNTEN